MRLIQVYLNNMETPVADEQWKKIAKNGLDKIHFAWAGSTEPGKPHYYRIHGPRFLIELDNSQNNGNHVHTVLARF
ncbi:MAG: DUF3500 domain-containing protein [Bacteroidia bacterium]|nr:DUF3500 domain-containing protein [Bacteroidia bacterium]